MKKIVLALVVLMFAAPAWATVNITCTDLGEHKVLVSFDASSEPNLVRAFGLNIQCDNDANIVDVNDNVNPDYWVFPGTIIITGNVVTYKGTAVGEVGDSPDTLPGPPDSNGATIEMATLYYPPDGPGSPNAPDPCAPLVILTVDKDTCITISGNVARAGATGVVMESPDEVVTVNVTGCCVQACACLGDYDANLQVDTMDMNWLLFKLFEKVDAIPQYVWDPVPPGFECMDLDGNNILDTMDMNYLLFHLFAYPPTWVAPCYP